MIPEFTVQFDRVGFHLDFDAAPNAIVQEIHRPDPALQIELARHQRAVEATLNSIENRLAEDASTLHGIHDRLLDSFMRYAELVARCVFTTDSELIGQRLKEQLSIGIAEFGFDGDVQIRIHPDCFDFVEAYRVENELAFTLETDSLLEPGDCLIESPGKGLIARLEKRLEHARLATVGRLVDGGNQ